MHVISMVIIKHHTSVALKDQLFPILDLETKQLFSTLIAANGFIFNVSLNHFLVLCDIR